MIIKIFALLVAPFWNKKIALIFQERFWLIIFLYCDTLFIRDCKNLSDNSFYKHCSWLEASLLLSFFMPLITTRIIKKRFHKQQALCGIGFSFFNYVSESGLLHQVRILFLCYLQLTIIPNVDYLYFYIFAQKNGSYPDFYKNFTYQCNYQSFSVLFFNYPLQFSACSSQRLSDIHLPQLGQ